jgi:dipeptidyl aminopeptidase/acylaminoacyl peptidase
MMPENGGESIQITKGNGPDLVTKFGSDPDRILYFQLIDYSNVWLGNLKSSAPKQLTFDERLICDPAISPDGKLLAFTIYKPSSELSPENQIYITDRDGSNPRKITSGYYRRSNSRFSPDGKYLAFSQVSVSEENDKANVYIIDLHNRGNPKYIQPGLVEMWADNNSIVVNRGHYTEIVSIADKSSKRISEDSTLAFPVATGKLKFYFDLHYKTFGNAYVALADKNQKESIKSPLYTHSFNDIQNFQSVLGRVFTQNYFYWLNSNSELQRFNYLTGEIEKFSRYPNASNLWGVGFNIGYDDKEILYVEYKHRGKIVMIDDPFIN